MTDLGNYAPQYRYVVSHDEDSRPWAEWADQDVHTEGMSDEERARWLDPDRWASFLVTQERRDPGGSWEVVDAVGGFDQHDDHTPTADAIVPGTYVRQALPAFIAESFAEDGPPVPSGLIDPDPYGIRPGWGTDSAETVEAAREDVPNLLRAFLWGTCAQREAAYRDLTGFVLRGLVDALHVLQDAHDDGCPCGDGEEVPGDPVPVDVPLPWREQGGSHGYPILRATPGPDYVPSVDVVSGLDVVNVLLALDHDGPEVEVTVTREQAERLYHALGEVVA